MLNKLRVLVLALLTVPPLMAAPFKLGTAVSVTKTSPITLYVSYTGAPPDAASPYLNSLNWKAEWQINETDRPTIVMVGIVGIYPDSQTLGLSISGNLPAVVDMRTVIWTISLISDAVPFMTLSFNPAPNPTDNSCDDPTKTKHFFCPPSPTDTPDFSFSGSFLTAGGTSPIYTIEVKGGIIFPQKLKYRFSPALNTQIEVNQNVTPPVHRTRFDPDSITAGFALTNVITFGKKATPKGPFLGMRLQAQLPEGEFSRTDPSSNIIAAGLATFDFKPLHRQSHPSLFGTFYPFIGMEVGRNLNRPHVIDMTAFDLSQFKGIVRGYLGADAMFAVASADRKSNIFSVTGTYRVRLPAVDESFIETLHQVTIAGLTTKARHWVETDVNYTFPGWKYLSLSAIYQYGELPPIFSFVDHKLTIGFKLQAVQTTKALGSKLVQ